MVNLSAKSIKHFMPDAEIYCLSLYKHNPSEYDDQEPLLPFIEEFREPTKFVNSNSVMDHEDSTKTSGFQNADNVKYFVEGYNLILKKFKNFNKKILILAEDHFFTTGAVLNELYVNRFDLGYAPWDDNTDANASIICLRPSAVDHLFPMAEYGPPVERHLREQLVLRVPNRYMIKNRKHANYFGDGKYTNSSAEIERELIKAGIL